MKNKNKLIVLVSGVLVILLMVVSVSFAIFRFGTESTNQELVLGDIWMKYTESNGISLENALPGDEYTNYFEFTITGTNTYTKKDIFYDISLTHGDTPAGKTEDNRVEDKYLKFKLTEVNGNTETEIFTDKTYDDLTNKRVHVDTISKSTNEYSKTYRLYMVISEELTYGNAEGAVLTTEEFGKIFGSIKVNVTGDFTPKEVEIEATDASCFTTEETIFYTINDNMTEEELNKCVTYINELDLEDYYWDGPDDLIDYCRGTGFINHDYSEDVTFYENLNGFTFNSDDLNYFVTNNIVTATSGASITGYDTSCGSDIIIPKVIGNYQVVKITENAFYNSNLTSAIIQNGVRIIGYQAFESNSLTTIEIPSSVELIELGAFRENSLTNVKFATNSNLKVINTQSFWRNTITEVTIPDSVVKLACEAFDQDVVINKNESLSCIEIGGNG